MSIPPVFEPEHLLKTLPLFGIFLSGGWVMWRVGPIGRRIGVGLALVGSSLVAFASFRLVRLEAFSPHPGFSWTGYDWQVEMAMIGVFLGISTAATGLALAGSAIPPTTSDDG